MAAQLKTLSLGQWLEERKRLHNPELYTTRSGGSGNWDVVVKRWPNRPALALAVRMQEKRESRNTDWRPVVPLTETEGY